MAVSGGIVSGAAPSEPRVAPLWRVGSAVLKELIDGATGTAEDSILTEGGDALMTEGGDFLVIESEVIPVVWSATDKHPDISIDVTGKIATNDAGAPGAVAIRSATGKSTGKWYAEFLLSDGGASTYGCVGVGQATPSIAGTYRTGDGASDYGYYAQDGNKYNNGAGAACSVALVAGQVVSIAFDADTGALWFGIDGTWISGDPEGGTSAHFDAIPSAEYFLMGSMFDPAETLTLRTAASEIVYTVPATFAAWES